MRAVLSLGSNLGDREATLRAAVQALAQLPSVVPVAASGLVETPALKPHGVDREAPAYLNAVVIVETDLAPDDLLTAINRIEHDHGRVRSEHWGDRTLDIDIVSVDGLWNATERLTLPHPRAQERGFVIVPWLDVDPDAVLPGFGPIAALAAATDSDVRRYPAGGLL